MIGQFCGPYSTVRPAFRPAKFESLVQHSVANMSHQENFETYLNELRTNRENQQRPEESMPNFQIDFLELLEVGQRQIEKGEHDKEDETGMSQELDDFISSEKSENTLKKTHYQWKKFEMFCKEQTNGNFNAKNVPADALDKLLGKFFKDVRKHNGSEYESDSLSSFQRSIQRRLKELKMSFNILKDEEFCRSREVLAAQRKDLVKQGRGNKPNACSELTSEEEEKLLALLVAIIPKRSSAHHGGSFHSTSDSEPGTKAENCAGVIWSFKLTLKQAEKSWFGWQKEGARLAKDWKVRTSASLIRKYWPREQSSAQSDISRFSKVTVLKKTKLQPPLSFWPQTTTLCVLNPLGTRCRLSAKTKSANSCRKQPKKLDFK